MSKSNILARIKNNKPELASLPDISVFQHMVSEDALIDNFIKISTLNMSNVVDIRNTEISLKAYVDEFIVINFPEAKGFYNTLSPKEPFEEIDFGLNIDLFIAEAKLGVAENGCLWFDDSMLKQRISIFACEHTILIIDHKNIIPTMHQAYQKIMISETGYGVFIAGPSKTADIEQSLVVGAQGAVSNTILIF